MMCLRTVPLVLATLFALSTECLADGFEIQPGYRSARSNSWKGSEFSLHYLSHDEDVVSYGAYFSNTTWEIDSSKRGQIKEFGPEVRFNNDTDYALLYLGLEYAVLSDGSYATKIGNDVGAKIRGPRLTAGALFPIESIGLIFSIGVGKGWEKLESYSSRHRTSDFSSQNIFIGISI